MQRPVRRVKVNPTPRTGGGYRWLHVLGGRWRAESELAEFDSHLPHWFGDADDRPAEFVSILGPQGQRFHDRARYRPLIP